MTAIEETPSTRTRGARRKPAQQVTAATLRSTERRSDAIRLRIDGLSYEAIAGQLGYTDRSAAFKAVEAGRRELLAEPAAELVTLETDRLDVMLVNAWQVLNDAKAAGDGDLRLRALDRLVRISERRSRLLGLDAPARTDVTTDGGQLTVVFDSALAPNRALPVGTHQLNR